MFGIILLVASILLASSADEFNESDNNYGSNTENHYKNEDKNQYEANNEYHPKGGYQSKNVFCLGVDVTNDCIYRADNNYAIDDKPRSGYVACVNKRPICMPCPYGLNFCSKAGYKGLGQCLGKYDECPPRNY